jgi:hypothetical protein
MGQHTPRLVVDEVLDEGNPLTGAPAVYALRVEPVASLTLTAWRPLRRAARRSIERVADTFAVAVRIDEQIGRVEVELTVHAWADDPADAVEFLRQLRCWANREPLT